MIPTLVDSNVDGKFVLWESRAIASYLVEQYGKDHFLYPKDPKRKAIINQRLYFDMGTLYKSLCDYYYPIYFEGKKAEPEKFKKIEENFEVLEKLLDGQEYAAADHLTLADFSLIASITTFEPTGIDLKQYENVTRWITKCKQTIVGYEINQIGVNAFEALINPANQ
jgi:glutathione S-transferase